MDLVVRPWAEDDERALGAAVADSLEHLRPWMPWAADEPRGAAARRAWIRQAAAGEAEHFGIFLDGTVVGGCGLHRRIGPGGLEIGYWVRATHTRRGIATAAVRRVSAVALARPSVDRVEIHHDAANVASGRVAAAAGFARAGELRRPPQAPAETGVLLVWRLGRGDRAAT
jgi:RimJ/RimL family protein N-acetyltransferase